jgi:hypothetical protein
VATGALLAEVDVQTIGIFQEDVRRVYVDHRRSRVLVVGRGLHVFDAMSLQPDGATLLWPFQAGGFLASHFDEAGARLYVTTVGFLGSPEYTHRVLDTTTLATVISASGPRGEFVAIPAVPPPTALAATITGTTVALTWAAGAPLAVTHYALEVGSGPGQNDILSGLDLGLLTSFGASGVPPGTYYVRVRAGNFSGLSTPSNEVVVTVP